MEKLIKKQSEILRLVHRGQWFRVYHAIRETDELIDYAALAAHSALEEVVLRAIEYGNDDLTRLLLTRDRQIVTRYPHLRGLQAAKSLADHYVAAWQHSAQLRILIGIHDHIDATVQTEPHADYSDLIMRATRFPTGCEEFRLIIGACIAQILHYQSLPGLAQTITSLRERNYPVYADALGVLVWYPEYHDRADFLWEHSLVSRLALENLLTVAADNNFPAESLEWIQTHLSAETPVEELADF